MHRKFAVIAALQREVQPLVKAWSTKQRSHEGHEFTFYEGEHAVVVCGGIGAEAARRAAAAAIAHYSPEAIFSVGIAGALVPELHVGDTVFPALVIDAQDNSRHETANADAPAVGRTLLVSYPEIASAAQKLQLAKSYGAQAVDMEAAAVARAAQVHNLSFVAIKAISDEVDFELPEMQQFIRSGEFDMARFLLHITPRPWLWPRVIRLARNTRIAAENLCASLRESVLTNTIVPASISRQKS